MRGTFNGHHKLLSELQAHLGRVHEAMERHRGDVQEHQFAYGPFKKAVLSQLWDAFEAAEPSHQRLASQVETVVRKLSHLDLEPAHVEALAGGLDALARPELSIAEVRDCERLLYRSGLATGLELGEQRPRLLEIYLSEDEDEGEHTEPTP